MTGAILFTDDYSTEKKGKLKKCCDNFRTQYLKISYVRERKKGIGNIWLAYLTLGYVSRLLLKRCRRNKYLPAIFTFIIVSMCVLSGCTEHVSAKQCRLRDLHRISTKFDYLLYLTLTFFTNIWCLFYDSSLFKYFVPNSLLLSFIRKKEMINWKAEK